MARTARERITGDPASSTIYDVLMEQISALPEIILLDPAAIDSELLQWIREGHDLTV